MKLSHTMGLSALATLVAASGVASADVAAKNTYYAPNGVVVTTSDADGGAICKSFGFVPGTISSAVIIYPGARVSGVGGANMTLVSPSTPSTATSAGSTLAYTCRAGTLTPVSTKEAYIDGTIAGTTLTVTKVMSGALAVGQTITGTGIAANTTIVSGSGTSWKISQSATVTKAEAISASAVTGARWTPAYVPAGGLGGATIPFACFADSQSGGAGDGGHVYTSGDNPVATANITFNVAQTSNGTLPTNTLSAATTEVVTAGGATCTYETDATWFAR